MSKTQPRVTARRIDPADVRTELDAWEAKYGVSSERLVDAFIDPESGGLVETDEFFEWCQAYAVRCRMRNH